MKRLEIVPPALAEAAAAREYYAAIRPELAAEFAAELSRALHWVQSHPLTWAPIGRRARRRLLNHFPYAVIYRIEPDCIRVLALMHQRQRPGYWRGR
ncbi:MAG: type II toxin-antitoxin system RelE/ParE family toxin [Burkholderiales bacterium]|nr:type II toxin-antitoxin system RelE/ParE family toxin [Burkholderiales bacterium]